MDHQKQTTTYVENEQTAPLPRKKPGTLSYKTEQALRLAVNHGVDPKEAYTLVNGHPPTRSVLCDFKKKVGKYALSTPPMQKLSYHAVKDTLLGKEVRYDAVKILGNGVKVPYQEVIVPSYTNKLAAAAMVYDRVEPLRGSSSSGPAQFTQINVNVYGNGADEFSQTQGCNHSNRK